MTIYNNCVFIVTVIVVIIMHFFVEFFSSSIVQFRDVAVAAIFGFFVFSFHCRTFSACYISQTKVSERTHTQDAFFSQANIFK